MDHWLDSATHAVVAAMAIVWWLVLDVLRFMVLDPGARYYWLTCVSTAVILVVVYVRRADWRARWGGGFLRFCFPKGAMRHRSTWLDVKMNIANYVVVSTVEVFWRFNTGYFAALVAASMVAIFGPSPLQIEWSFGVVIGFSVLLVVADDFAYFVWHWLAHKVPFLWTMHRVHHSAEVLTPLAGFRQHPVEFMMVPVFRSLGSALVAGPAFYLIAGEPMVLAGFGVGLVSAIFALPLQQLTHSHVPVSWGDRLNRIFICPATHQIHHSADPAHRDKNMGGYLAIWDRMAGTLCLPKPGEQLTYGLGDPTRPPLVSLRVALLQPFAEMAAMTKATAAYAVSSVRRKVIMSVQASRLAPGLRSK